MTFQIDRDLTKVFRLTDSELDLIKTEIDGYKIGKFKANVLVDIFDPHDVYVEGDINEKTNQIKFEAYLYLTSHDVNGFEVWGFQNISGVYHSGIRLFSDPSDFKTSDFIEELLKRHADEYIAYVIDNFKKQEFIRLKTLN